MGGKKLSHEDFATPELDNTVIKKATFENDVTGNGDQNWKLEKNFYA